MGSQTSLYMQGALLLWDVQLTFQAPSPAERFISYSWAVTRRRGSRIFSSGHDHELSAVRDYSLPCLCDLDLFVAFKCASLAYFGVVLPCLRRQEECFACKDQCHDKNGRSCRWHRSCNCRGASETNLDVFRLESYIPSARIFIPMKVKACRIQKQLSCAFKFEIVKPLPFTWQPWN